MRTPDTMESRLARHLGALACADDALFQIRPATEVTWQAEHRSLPSFCAMAALRALVFVWPHPQRFRETFDEQCACIPDACILDADTLTNVLLAVLPLAAVSDIATRTSLVFQFVHVVCTRTHTMAWRHMAQLRALAIVEFYHTALYPSADSNVGVLMLDQMQFTVTNEPLERQDGPWAHDQIGVLCRDLALGFTHYASFAAPTPVPSLAPVPLISNTH